MSIFVQYNWKLGALQCLVLLAAFAASAGAPADAGIFKVATYNVENLFDAKCTGTEYPDYVPGGSAGWNRKLAAAKVERIARVIADLHADVVALQEVESAIALGRLRDRLESRGVGYPHAAIADRSGTAVRCAVLSRYPITHERAIAVGRKGARDILQVVLDIEGSPLVLFVNHWKAKPGPESLRVAEARILRAALRELSPHTDYLLLGDFNSDYNELATVTADADLNDTGGRTGINHVLATRAEGRPVTETLLTAKAAGGLHYDLWMELAPGRRWSTDHFGRRHTPDHILLPAALYDDRGLSYVDGSFDKFDPGYLFFRGRIFRWQRAQRGNRRHLGTGYSDHLPIFALFTTAPFSREPARRPAHR